METQKNSLELRRDAAQATLDTFRDRPFELGKNDCAKMANFLLKQMNIGMATAKVGKYTTPISGRAALKRAYGVETLHQLMDKYFEPILASQAIVGDIIEFRGVDSAIGAIAVYLGNDIVLAYHEDATEGAIAGRIIYEEGDEPLAAWRTLPL